MSGTHGLGKRTSFGVYLWCNQDYQQQQKSVFSYNAMLLCTMTAHMQLLNRLTALSIELGESISSANECGAHGLAANRKKKLYIYACHDLIIIFLFDSIQLNSIGNFLQGRILCKQKPTHQFKSISVVLFAHLYGNDFPHCIIKCHHKQTNKTISI